MTIEVQNTVEGWYTLYKVKASDWDGRIDNKTPVAGPFKNLITDQGLNYMGNNPGWFGFCQVGEGNSTPSTSDTGLATYKAGVSINSGSSYSSTGVVVGPPTYAWAKAYYQFGVGAAAGNITEVGTGWAVSGSTLYSRALILDNGGVPTTVSVLSDEILIVYYELRVYPPTSDVTGTTTIASNSYNWTLRAAESTSNKGQYGNGWGFGTLFGYINTGRSAAFDNGGQGGQGAYPGAMASITGRPTGTMMPGAFSSAAYVNNSLERAGTITFGIDATNNIRSLFFTFGWSAYQMEFDPVIPKTNINVATFTVKHSWARRTL